MGDPGGRSSLPGAIPAGGRSRPPVFFSGFDVDFEKRTDKLHVKLEVNPVYIRK
jgi:hypothetical protein